MMSSIHSVNIESYHVAGTVQDAGDITMKTIDKNPCPCGSVLESSKCLEDRDGK